MEKLNSELYKENADRIICLDPFYEAYDDLPEMFEHGKDIVIPTPLENETDIETIGDDSFVIPDGLTLWVNPLEVLADEHFELMRKPGIRFCDEKGEPISDNELNNLISMARAKTDTGKYLTSALDYAA